MYISEISKSKISDHKAQKMTILWTQEVGTPILKHPVYFTQSKISAIVPE